MDLVWALSDFQLGESLSLGHCGSASLGCSGYRFGSKADRVYVERLTAGAGEVLGRTESKDAKGL